MLGALAIAVGGLALTGSLELYYTRTSELTEVAGDSSVSEGTIAWETIPFLVLAIFIAFTSASMVAAAISLAGLALLTVTAFDAAYTTDSSTAGLALAIAPLYGLAVVGLVLLVDVVIRAALGNRRPRVPNRAS